METCAYKAVGEDVKALSDVRILQSFCFCDDEARTKEFVNEDVLKALRAVE